MLKDYVSEINDLEKKLLDRFSPGMLTILFKKNNNIFDEITCGSEYIGIRIPDNTLLLDVINELGNPIVSTSANISGEVITNVNMINDELKKHISYIYDDGEKTNISSTLVKVENNKIKILREGVLADIIKKEYNKYIGD
jgi:L-threonylcarbamoyladenylate synthase